MSFCTPRSHTRQLIGSIPWSSDQSTPRALDVSDEGETRRRIKTAVKLKLDEVLIFKQHYVPFFI